MHKRGEAFKRGFEAREGRVRSLEERGKQASQRAEELGRRLENCRIIVRNWEDREIGRQKGWDRFFKTLTWVGVIVFVFFGTGFVLVRIEGKAQRAASADLSSDSVLNKVAVPGASHSLSELAVQVNQISNASDTVREVLLDIASQDRAAAKEKISSYSGTGAEAIDDPRLRLLDEL